MDPGRWLLPKLIQRITGTIVYWGRRNKVTQLSDREISRKKKIVLCQPNANNKILITEIDNPLINA